MTTPSTPIVIGSKKPFNCPLGWTVKDAEDRIRIGYRLDGGWLVMNNSACLLSDSIGNGNYEFIEFEERQNTSIVESSKLISVFYLYQEDRYKLAVNVSRGKDIKDQIIANIYLLNNLPKPATRAGFLKFNVEDEDRRLITSFDAIIGGKDYWFYQPDKLIPLPPCKWSRSQLDQLKIQIESIDFDDFFNLLEGNKNKVPVSPVASSLQKILSPLSAHFLDNYRTDRTISMEELNSKRKFLMENKIYEHPILKSCFLMRKYEDHESIVDSFVSLLFKELGYYEKLLYVFPQLRLPLYFGTTTKESKADFVIFDLLSYFRIAVIEDKNYESETLNSVPQLTAELISLHQNNKRGEGTNKKLKTDEFDMNQPLLGIRVNGKSFSFYLLKMTEQLNQAMYTESAAISSTPLYYLGGRAFDFFDQTERNMIIEILDRIKFDLMNLAEISERQVAKDL